MPSRSDKKSNWHFLRLFCFWAGSGFATGRLRATEAADERIVMIEFALEKFPVSMKLRDGTPVVVRPLAKRDEAKFHKFFLAVPEEERLFIKQPIFERKMFHEWCRHLDYESNLPLLMLHGSKIIGEATLHQRMGGWKRHIGLIGVLTHPGYRGRDVVKILVEEQVEIARILGLRKLESELNGERKVAIHALEQIGFTRLMCLEDYVLDMKAVPHDLILMGMNLKVDEEYAGVGG
jgi:RimJ/RimL family protein N-acetyltransferase